MNEISDDKPLMSMKTWTLFFSLILSSQSWAQDLNAVVTQSFLNLQGHSGFLDHAVSCYEKLGPENYRRLFCEHTPRELINFEDLIVNVERDKDRYRNLWRSYMDGSQPIPDDLIPIKNGLEKEVLDCLKSEGLYDDDWIFYPEDQNGEWLVNHMTGNHDANQGTPPPSVASFFLPSDAHGVLSLNPETFNLRLGALESYGPYLGEQDRSLINLQIEREVALRRKILIENPELISLMINELDALAGSGDLFWYEIERQTGIPQHSIPPSVRENYEILRHYREVYDRELNNLSIETIINHGQVVTTEQMRQALGWSEEEYNRQTTRLFLHPEAEESKRLTQEMIHDRMGRYESEIYGLAEGRWQIEDIYRKVYDEMARAGQFPEGQTKEEYFDCYSIQERRLEEISTQNYLVDFYSDPQNRNFMTSQFEDARAIMKSTLQEMDLSSSTRDRLQRHLDEARFHIPEMNRQNWTQMHRDITETVDSVLSYDPYLSYEETYDEIKLLTMGAPQYRDFGMLDFYDGVNAFYQHSVDNNPNPHSVGATCGLAHAKVQADGPEFFLITMGHELGHALDMAKSDTALAQYSPESRQKAEELRQCLIAQNGGEHLKIDEDLADHFEAHFIAQWIKREQNSPDWPLKRQRFLRLHYEGLCESDSFYMANHSSRNYRTGHLFSHPTVKNEFSEINFPTVPFCSQLLPAIGGVR